MSAILSLKARLLMVHRYFTSVNNTLLIVLFIFINLMISGLFSWLSYAIEEKVFAEDAISFDSTLTALLLGIVGAPIIETLLFQVGIIEVMKKKRSILISCIVSALIFAVFHFYNYYYFAFTYLSGLMLAYLYCIKKSIVKGFLVTTIAHASYNLIGYLISIY